ncbi:MAG: FkbM family methyltransferase [Acidobacteriia bacterium]|nr:FkbM family methyltransferase [Terriglobia bacterium]
MLAPRTGSGALIYYQGRSEPETALFISGFLKPGMIFFDVGAHIGEYTLLASRAVQSEGQVHAFEPVHELFKLLKRTLTCTAASNVVVNHCALANTNGTTNFVVYKELSCSSIANDEMSGSPTALRTDSVPVQSLDRYCEQQGVTPHLIKVDVEGAELLVLEGAKALLALPPDRAPVWVIEYSEENYARFGMTVDTLRARFIAAGWYLYALRPDGRLELLVGNFRNEMNVVAIARPYVA